MKKIIKKITLIISALFVILFLLGRLFVINKGWGLLIAPLIVIILIILKQKGLIKSIEIQKIKVNFDFFRKNKILKKTTIVIIAIIAISSILIIWIGCSKYPDLGEGYKLASDGKYTLSIINFENTRMIPETILEYAFDSNFIIVSQRPWDSIPNVETMNYTESNEAFEKSTFQQYWIINKKEKSVYSFDESSKLARYSNVYGPFQKDEYLLKRDELKIPKELELKNK